MALLTRFVDHAAADDTGDGSVGDPWKYIYQATGAIATDAGTNQFKVWIKASETYGTDEDTGTSLESDDADHDGAGGDAGAILFLDQAGTATLPNVFEGYHTNTGDGGIVKLDCQGATNQLTNAVLTSIGGSVFTVFKNFDMENSSGNVASAGPAEADDITVWKKCRFNNGVKGFGGDNSHIFVACLAENNSSHGIDGDNGIVLIACVSHTNGGLGYNGAATPIFYNSLAYNNTSHDYDTTSGGVGVVLGCSSDGENAAGDFGYHQNAGSGHLISVVNCIFFDSDFGINSDVDVGELAVSRHNVFDSSNTDDVNNWLTPSLGAPTPGVGGNGDIIDPGDPYIGSGARNYDPAAAVQAKGLDANWTVDFWADYNDGAGDNPPEE